MSDLDLQAIEARLNRVTPGRKQAMPSITETWFSQGERATRRNGAGYIAGVADFDADGEKKFKRYEDAEFCPHAYEDVPALLAEVKLLRETLEPFSVECTRQERIRSYRDGDCLVVDSRLTIGDLRRASIAFYGVKAAT